MIAAFEERFERFIQFIHTHQSYTTLNLSQWPVRSAPSEASIDWLAWSNSCKKLAAPLPFNLQ
jgi:hypothetical protein